jgi:hypothetical protein
VILVHVQDIVKGITADAKLPDVTAIPCEIMGNYEMAMMTSDVHGSGRVITIIGTPGPS